MRIWVWSISLPWLLLLNASPQIEAVRPMLEVSQDLSNIPVVKLWGRVWYAHPESLGELYSAIKPMLSQVGGHSSRSRQDRYISGSLYLPSLSPLQYPQRSFSPIALYPPVKAGTAPLKQGMETRAGPTFS